LREREFGIGGRVLRNRLGLGRRVPDSAHNKFYRFNY
jgi:hypothetical protein